MVGTVTLLCAVAALAVTSIAYADSVDGNWGSWLEWDPCSVSCGEGERRRMRFCNNPPPRNGGALCAGNAIEYQQCEAPIGCLVDGEWSKWSPWTPCSVTCGEGMKSRQRNCDSPPPANGGRNCAGSSTQRTTCASGEDCPNTPVCASPPDIEGAITSLLNPPVGTAVTYSCPYGFKSRNSSNHVSVCTVNPITGRPVWTAPEISCIVRPGYIEVDNINITVLENVGTVLATLNRVQGADGIITIQYRTVDGTARAQTDYEPVNGELTFNGGERRKTVAVTIFDDTVWEPTEIFQLQFFNTTVPSDVINFSQQNSTLNVTVKILDNDMTPGYIEMELITITVLEEVRTVNVSLVRLGGTNGQIKIHYRTVDGTALVRSDYVPVTGEVVFNDGEDKKLIPVSIIDDDIREPTENFQVLLFDPSAGPDVVNFTAQTYRLAATVVILDNDMKPGYLELEHVDFTVQEDNGTLQVGIVRIGGTDGILQLKFRTVEAEATAELDYVPALGDLVFEDGESRKTIDVIIVNDDIRESSETFELQIYDLTAGPDTNNFRALGTRLTASIKIIDDDARPGYLELEHVNVTVKEDSGTLQVNVIRIGGTDGILNLKYKTLDVSAAAQLDYVPVEGDLVFKDGESKKTINILIVNDDVIESLEAFQLQIFDITPEPGIINFRSLGTKLITHITIIDDNECGTNRMGTETRNMPLVTGVTYATEGTWPWMATIQMKWGTGSFGPHCTGFLIDKKHVVSAAYCFVHKQTHLYRVLLGSVDQEAGEEYFITRIVVPAVYAEYSYFNNIAILTLSRDVDIPNFVPVCLPDNPVINMNLVGRGITAVGRDGWDRRYLKQSSDIHVLSNEECDPRIRRLLYEFKNGLTSAMLCAGLEGDSRVSAFERGSPLMLLDRNRWYAVGIFCKSAGSTPGIVTYTRVTSYTDWIRENTRD